MKTDLFTKIVLLLILGCLVVLVFKGITVTHKSEKPYVNPITERYGAK